MHTTSLPRADRRRRGIAAAAGPLLVALIASVLTLATPSPASAAPTGRVIASPSVILRSGPSTAHTRIGSIPKGVTVAINCTARGTSLSGPYGLSNVWDHVTYNGVSGYVSDAWMYTGSANPVAGPCGAPAPAPASPGPATSRENRAVAWAQSQIGASRWNGLCLRFVANAFGKASSGYPTAYQHYLSLRSRRLINGGSAVPRGALAYYAPAPINGHAGHVQISEGNGSFVTTGATVRRVSLTWPGATYLGWAWADPAWPGR